MPSRDPKRPGREWYGTSRWQKFRRAYLAQNALCVLCKAAGVTRAASVVDHKQPHRGDPVKFWMGPFQALCKPCHDSTKQAQEKTGVLRGCDPSGTPLDPGHHWRGEGRGEL